MVEVGCGSNSADQRHRRRVRFTSDRSRIAAPQEAGDGL